MQAGDDVGQRQAAKVFTGPRAQGDATFGLFLLADDEQVRHFLQRVFADLVADFFVAHINRGAQPGPYQGFQHALRIVGLTFADVVKTTVFLTNMGDFAAMNEVYGKYFTRDFPARSTIQVAALPKGASVEIEVVAHYEV